MTRKRKINEVTSARRSKRIRTPWKQNLIKVPQQILAKVKSQRTDTIVVGCALKLKTVGIQHNTYRHIGLILEDNQVRYEPLIVPLSEVGRYSRYNREGRELIYKNLPKQSKSWFIEAPNYGDMWKGTHSVLMSKDVYQRELVAPKLVPIKIELIGEAIQDQALIFKFTVEEILDRRAEDFEDQLLFNLNILQENVGNHGVYASEATRDDYLKTLYVNWELLPPGEKEETLNRILVITGNNAPETRARIVDRYDFLRSLKPQQFIAGTNEFRRYFGAQFANDLVVFENVDYGNAVYVMFEDWEQLSRKSRTDLLSSRDTGFERILHTKNWKLSLRKLLQRELKKRAVVNSKL